MRRHDYQRDLKLMIQAKVLGLILGVLATTSAIAHAQPALAEQQPGGTVAPSRSPAPARFGVAGRISTLGVGVDFGVPVMERATFRVAVNQFGWSHDFEDGGFDIAAKLKMRSLVAQWDWYPFNGGFHVSPGLMLYNGIQIEATMTASTNQPFSLGDETFISAPSNPMRGEVAAKFRRVAPTIAVGWGNLIPRTTTRRWSIPVELGIVATRSPAATWSLRGSACWVDGTHCRDLASDASLQNDIADEQAEMNNDLKPLKFLPIISVGFSYKF
jgi:hypothetical protein